MSGWVQVTAPSPMAYERYDQPSREPTLGQLGLAPTGTAVVSKAGGAAASTVATGLATYVGAGSAAGPIGMAVGLVVGLVLTKLLHKDYLNVAAMNTAEANEIAAFNQYRGIMGQAAGRQFGLDAMRAVWKGALHSGYFPLNHETQCFHNGCSAHPGNASLIDSAIDSSAQWPTFSRAYQEFTAARTTGAPSAGTGMVRALPVARSMFAARLRGLGSVPTLTPADLAAARLTPVPDAVTFIDHFFIPDNQRMNSLWPIPQQSIEHQILYDVADAWLAQQPITTTPYVASRPYAQPASTAVVAPDAPYLAPTVSPPLVPVPGYGTSSRPIDSLPPSNEGLWPPPGTVTSAQTMTNRVLDEAMSKQGLTRAGTTAQGIPIYVDAQGNTFLYSNAQLYPYGSAAQLAATGASGQGVATPVTGIDPQTLQVISAALAQGLTPAQAAQAGANNLQSQGIALTPQIQSQLLSAAQGAPSAGPLAAGANVWLMGAIAAGFLLFGMPKMKAA